MAAVPDRFALGECRQRLRRIRVISRLVSVLIVLATAVALLLALRDAIANGPARSFEWLPLIETTITTSSSPQSRCTSSTLAVILDMVSTIETLTTGMSRKIWQKISLLPDSAGGLRRLTTSAADREVRNATNPRTDVDGDEVG